MLFFFHYPSRNTNKALLARFYIQFCKKILHILHFSTQTTIYLVVTFTTQTNILHFPSNILHFLFHFSNYPSLKGEFFT
jgi:hypothetical protein